MSAATERPTAPDADDAPTMRHPRGCVCYLCERRAPGDLAPTVPAPRPCQRAALTAALLKRDAAVQEIGRAGAQLTSAEIALAVEDYQRERARLAGLRTAS